MYLITNEDYDVFLVTNTLEGAKAELATYFDSGEVTLNPTFWGYEVEEDPYFFIVEINDPTD